MPVPVMALDPHVPLLTGQHALQWKGEYETVCAEIEHLVSRRDGLLAKLKALDSLLDGHLSELIGATEGLGGGASTAAKPPAGLSHEPTMGEMVMKALADEPGGRPPRWFRERLTNDPATAARVKDLGSTTLQNTLSKLHHRGALAKSKSGLYYMPEIYRAIEAGEISDDWSEELPNFNSFNKKMHQLMREYGRPFDAAKAISVAKSAPELAEKLNNQPSRVYSWLSRELGRGNLLRSGSYYAYEPFEIEAEPPTLNGHGSASTFL